MRKPVPREWMHRLGRIAILSYFKCAVIFATRRARGKCNGPQNLFPLRRSARLSLSRGCVMFCMHVCMYLERCPLVSGLACPDDGDKTRAAAVAQKALQLWCSWHDSQTPDDAHKGRSHFPYNGTSCWFIADARISELMCAHLFTPFYLLR
jgi:hypothetical protein